MTIFSQEEFYEFILYDCDGSVINNKLVQSRVAEAVCTQDPSPLCISYPSFNILEKLVVYPTLSDRYTMLQRHGIDFNDIEERNIPPVTTVKAFEMELISMLKNQNFEKVKQVLMKYYSVSK